MWTVLWILLLGYLGQFAFGLTDLEKRQQLLVKCAHLNTNETLLHCFMREMQKIELKMLIKRSVENDDYLQTAATEFPSNPNSFPISFHCVGESCEGEKVTLPPNAVTISSTKPPPELKISPNQFWFNVAHLSHYNRIERAEVVFHLKKFWQKYANKTYVVSLNKYGEDNSINEHFSKGYRLNPSSIEGDENEEAYWKSIIVSNYFWQWQRNPLTNHGIQINVAVQDENGEIIFVENLMESNPVIYMEIINPQQVRRRRHSRNVSVENVSTVCTGINAKNTCCMYPFEVSLDELGFRWIVEPKTVRLNYCVGGCLDSGNKCCMSEQKGPLEIQYKSPVDNVTRTKTINNALIQKCLCV